VLDAVIVMKLATFECAIYTVQNFSHLIFRNDCTCVSVDKVGVIGSEPIAYAFTESVSLDISITQSKWIIIITEINKNHKGAFSLLISDSTL
jgi:hypothetical protein